MCFTVTFTMQMHIHNWSQLNLMEHLNYNFTLANNKVVDIKTAFLHHFFGDEDLHHAVDDVLKNCVTNCYLVSCD